MLGTLCWVWMTFWKGLLHYCVLLYPMEFLGNPCPICITLHDMYSLPSEKYHSDDFIRSAMASQITSLTIVYSTVYSGTDDRKHQRPASLAFVRGIHRWPVNSPHKGPLTRKMFPFDDVIVISYMNNRLLVVIQNAKTSSSDLRRFIVKCNNDIIMILAQLNI